MLKKMPALAIPILVTFLLFPSLSQGQVQGNKRLTYEQVYERAEPQLTAAFPGISGWADDSHCLVMERDEKTGFQMIFKINIKSGEKSFFFDWAPIQLIDKLMDEGKQFESMVYPNQRHGFGGQKRTHSNRHYVDFWFNHYLDR